MKKYYIFLAISIVILFGSASWLRAQDSGGYQKLAYTSQKTFASNEENQAYQSVMDCLAGNSANPQSCLNTSTISGILSSAQNQHDSCTAACENTYQSCQAGCTTTTSGGGDGPYEDATVNAAYRAAVQCLQSGTANCLHVVAAYGLPTSWVSEIVGKADSDVQNGTVWQSEPVTQIDYDCVNTCVDDDSSCVKDCGTVGDLKNKVNAAAQQALDDWQAAAKPLANTTTEPTPQPEPTPTPTPPVNKAILNPGQYDTTLAQGLSRKFDEIAKRTTPISPRSMVDANGNAITPDQLKKGLSDSLPEVSIPYDLKNIQKDQPINIDIPDGLPFQKVILTPSQAIDDGTMTVTIAEGSKPELIGVGAPGSPDYPPPIAPQENYNILNYIKVETKDNGQTLNPFSEALFGFLVPYLKADSNYEHLYRYGNKTWTKLEAEGGCYPFTTASFGCQVTIKAPGTSYFALEVKKGGSGSKILSMILLALTAAAIFYTGIKMGDEKPFPRPRGKAIFTSAIGEVLSVIVALLVALLAVALRKSYPNAFGGYNSYSTFLLVFLITLAVLYFIFYLRLKRSGKEAAFSHGPRDWLKGMLVDLVVMALLLVGLIFS